MPRSFNLQCLQAARSWLQRKGRKLLPGQALVRLPLDALEHSTAALASAASASALAACTEIEKFEVPSNANDHEGDAALARLFEQAATMQQEVWAKPAETADDLLLRAEIALRNENGLKAAFHDPRPNHDERAVAELIRPVIDVLGGLS